MAFSAKISTTKHWNIFGANVYLIGNPARNKPRASPDNVGNQFSFFDVKDTAAYSVESVKVPKLESSKAGNLQRRKERRFDEVLYNSTKPLLVL